MYDFSGYPQMSLEAVYNSLFPHFIHINFLLFLLLPLSSLYKIRNNYMTFKTFLSFKKEGLTNLLLLVNVMIIIFLFSWNLLFKLKKKTVTQLLGKMVI